nr:helix-turn-helix transcriptional regulator [Enterococcus villorum]
MQQELADKLFVSRQAVSNWENNKNFPDLKSIVLLSEILDVSLDDFLRGEKDLVKQLEKELKEINSIHFMGIIILSIVAFLVPAGGIVCSFLILKNYRKANYPYWIKCVAVIAMIFQLLTIVIIILSIPTSTEQFDNIKIILETP